MSDLDNLLKRYEAYKAKTSNKEYSKRNVSHNRYMANQDREYTQTPEWLAKTAESNRRQAKDPKWIEAHAKAMKETAQDPDWQAKNTKQMNRINNDPEIVAKRIARNQEVNRRPVTGPQGNFISVREFQNTTGMNFADKLRLLPHLYYYTEDGPAKAKYQNVYYSPLMTYCDSKTIYELYLEKGLIEERFTKLIFKPWIKWWAYMEKTNPKLFYKKNEPKRDWLVEAGIAPKTPKNDPNQPLKTENS